jgi:hypothetical protein
MHVQSVLQQQASRNLKCECNFSSPQATNGQQQPIVVIEENNGSNSSIEVENLIDNNNKKSSTSSALTPVKSPNQLQQNIKKQGVSGESCDVNFIGCSSDILIRKFEKDFK